MKNWIIRLLGLKAPDAPKPLDLATATLEQIDDANIALGQQIDAIREQRKVLVRRAAELRDKKGGL